MVTATSKVACLLGLAALGLGGCGAGYGAVASSPVSGHAGSARTVAATGAGFAWLVPAPAPPGWSVARLASGATLAYPPGWHAIHGDRGTASAALFDTAGHYLGYLNLTPRQGAESPTGWASFRVRHNRAEGDTHVVIAEARAGDGSDEPRAREELPRAQILGLKSPQGLLEAERRQRGDDRNEGIKEVVDAERVLLHAAHQNDVAQNGGDLRDCTKADRVKQRSPRLLWSVERHPLITALWMRRNP